MPRSRINYLIGYGILIFLIGFFAGVHWLKYFQWLIFPGAIMTFFGIYFFFKYTDLAEKFAPGKIDDLDDALTYFWNVVVLKLWTFIIAVWMIVMVIHLLTAGYLE